ncbi:uncharacterized protein [Blastocystis hominis]|uniref:Peptidyl-prolyl cis-trans isomerase n=1 Tax=Blastocystis hominis TaxID=12968 RepID=D8LZP2_BLAHO|nr:uncharacterized protein [Blastocystis hominis]CBK21281.2 unnamed protein product [Blastocystis hominis]|eukprot:XP_012895329.1 uncharacterized protein [Blastocystis hominis]
MNSSNPQETFKRIAEKESDCSSAKRGGDLGFFKRGQMQKPFEDCAFRLKVGEISNIIETDSGVHIILRIACCVCFQSFFEYVVLRYTPLVPSRRIPFQIIARFFHRFCANSSNSKCTCGREASFSYSRGTKAICGRPEGVEGGSVLQWLWSEVAV